MVLKRLVLTASFFVLILAGACTSITNTGSLQIQLTDDPITVGTDQITKVVVSISDVSAHTSGSAGVSDAGWTSIRLSNATEIDLLTLQNNVNQLLGTGALVPGRYQQLRITVASAQLTFADATTAPVIISSGVVHLNIDATIEAGKSYGVVLDFNAASSLKKVNTIWTMNPPVIAVKEVYIINSDGSHSPAPKGSGLGCTTGDTCATLGEKCCPSIDGKCIDILADVNNCGDCGFTCTGTQKCRTGVCL